MRSSTTVALPLLGVSLVGSPLLAADKPNIVYIMSDELAYFELAHAGNPDLITPSTATRARSGTPVSWAG